MTRAETYARAGYEEVRDLETQGGEHGKPRNQGRGGTGRREVGGREAGRKGK